MIDKQLEERVARKRDIFLNKVKNLGISGEQLINIKELATSMERANILGETELASTYKELIKSIIKEAV